MPEIPAFCNSCGSIFGSGFVFDNCRNITLSGNTCGPCPNCGANGHVPDGVYDFTGNVVKLLSGPNRTVNELNKLAHILVNAKKQNLTKEQVGQKIQEEVPELNSISSVLPKTRGELYQFITLIIAAIAIILTSSISLSEKGMSEEEIDEMINKAIENSLIKQQTKDILPIKNKKKIGRNEPCPCNSGKKYKKCCLLI